MKQTTESNNRIRLVRFLNDLGQQKNNLQKQSELGIISLSDASAEEIMITKKEYRIKKQLVDTMHVKSNGMLRSIKKHEPTESYNDGYYYTKLKGGKIVKAKTLEALYSRLYDIYYSSECLYTIATTFRLAMDEKKITENPKENTIAKIENDFARFISDNLAECKITEVTETDLQRYSQELVNGKQTLTKKHFLAYKGVLNIIFNYATSKGIIDRNPVLAIRNRTYLKSCDCTPSKADTRIFSEEETELLMNEVDRRMTLKKYGSYYVNGYAMKFAIFTGVRSGELCSLKWEDIDTEKKQIHIHRQQLLKRVDGQYCYYYVDYTKNERGMSNDGRYFPLTREISELLNGLAEKQKARGIESEFVFCAEDGEAIKTKGYESFLRRICKNLGLKATCNHTFRRSFNSNVLIQNGVSVADRAKLLGHSVMTNLTCYSYEDRDYCERTRELLDNLAKEPFFGEKELFNTIDFAKRKSPQPANCKAFSAKLLHAEDGT